MTTNKIKKIVIYIFKIKILLLDASSMTIIWFNISEFNNHDHMIFQDYDHHPGCSHENCM
jgi:hypothetical protein